MEKQPNSLWDQLSNLLVPKRQASASETISNERVLHEIIRCFETSLNRESIGNSLLFDAHYVIILNPKSFNERIAAFPVIVNEAVNAFYALIKRRQGAQGQIVTVASHWQFKFGPGTEFDGREITPTDVEVIGSLTGASLEAPNVARPSASSNLKATRKVKNTNVYEKLDLNLPAFSHIDFRESGAFAVRIDPTMLVNESAVKPVVTAPAPVETQAVTPPPAAPKPARPDALARIDCYMADQNTEETYWMKDREVVIARQEPDNQLFANYIRLQSPYVSNPHARIRYDATAEQFQLASFSKHETRLNEQVVERSEPTNPVWVPLPSPSQILLNGVLTLHFERNE